MCFSATLMKMFSVLQVLPEFVLALKMMKFHQKFLPFSPLELCAVCEGRLSVFAARLTPDILYRKPHLAIRVISGPVLKLANCFTGTASLICSRAPF